MTEKERQDYISHGQAIASAANSVEQLSEEITCDAEFVAAVQSRTDAEEGALESLAWRLAHFRSRDLIARQVESAEATYAILKRLEDEIVEKLEELTSGVPRMIGGEDKWLVEIGERVRTLIRKPGGTDFFREQLLVWCESRVEHVRKTNEAYSQARSALEKRGVYSDTIDGRDQIEATATQFGLPPQIKPLKLPLPDRRFALCEKVAILAAVHDVTVGGEKIAESLDKRSPFWLLQLDLRGEAENASHDEPRLVEFVEDIEVAMVAERVEDPDSTTTEPPTSNKSGQGDKTTERGGAEAKPQGEPRDGQPSEPPHAEKPKTASSLKIPKAWEFKAYRLWVLKGWKQEEIETVIGKSQGSISRAKDKVEAWIKAGNVLPDLPKRDIKQDTVDPAVLDTGARQNGRTPRQREQRDPTSD